MENKNVVVGQVVLKEQYVLSFKDIFDHELGDPLLLLKDIPLTSALEEISFLLLNLTNIHKDDKNFHSSKLLEWMMKMNEADQSKMLQFVNSNLVFSHPNLKLTNRNSCLRLLQTILSVGNKSNEKMTKNDYGILFKSMLICNARENTLDWNTITNVEDLVNEILPIEMKNIEINHRKDYKIVLLKIHYFFEYFQSDGQYKVYIEKFLIFYNLQSYSQYIFNILYSFLLIMTNEKITCKIHIDENNSSAINFYNHFSVNERCVSIDDEDYISLRQFPIFKSGTATYTVLYMNFLVDKLYQGFLFDFVKISKEHVSSEFNYGTLKTDMGNRFSETHLFYIVMEKCFRFYGDFKKTGSELKVLLQEGEPDYIIRNKNQIFLFEFKDAAINNLAKYSGSAPTIKNYLIDKFESTKKSNGKIQNKAVNQLKNNLVRILSGEYKQKSIDNFDSNKVIIYPILVFTDVVMEAKGVNYFLKERLNTLIKNDNLPDNKIKDLILINLDTLILYQDLFRKGQINFADSLDSYLDYVSQPDSWNSVFSFDEYFKYYITRKGFSVVTKPEAFDNILREFILKKLR